MTGLLFEPDELPERPESVGHRKTHYQGRMTPMVIELIAWWNTQVAAHCKQLSKVTGAEQKSRRTTLIRARINDREFLDALPALAKEIRESRFLRGEAGAHWRTGKVWKVSFEWLLVGDNWRKVAEGNYRDDDPDFRQPADDEFVRRWKNEAADGTIAE